MVSLIVGFPGSGKSYKAVAKIYDILSSDKKQEFDIIYTNIGGIKFDYFPHSKIEFKKLKEDDLISYLTGCFELYEKYKDLENVDDYLIDYSKEKNFHNALFVFDECHDFFTPQDRVKIFWLTYHRHLHHEIILLTQNKSLINSKYRAIPEQFIEAQPRSKKIFSNTLNYKHYASFAMRKSDLFNSSSLKTNQEIFNLYQSGNQSKQKSIIVKFLVIMIAALFLAITVFVLIINSFKVEETNEQLKEVENVSTNTNTKPIKENIQSEYIREFTYEYENIIIEYESDNGYLIKDKYYPKAYFNHFLKRTKSKILLKETIYETTNYKMQKIMLRTKETDLNRFFYIKNKNINYGRETNIKEEQ